MSIVSCFVIMRVKFSAFIVREPISCIVGKLQAVGVVLVSGAFFVDNAETSLKEMLRVGSEDFSVVSLRELLVPVSDELSVSLRQCAYELVVDVDPVVHAVVANQGLFELYHSFNY